MVEQLYYAGNLSRIKSQTPVKIESNIHMCDTGVCLFRIRSSYLEKSPVVCFLCYWNYGKLSSSAQITN